jgi:hypothetical protein
LTTSVIDPYESKTNVVRCLRITLSVNRTRTNSCHSYALVKKPFYCPSRTLAARQRCLLCAPDFSGGRRLANLANRSREARALF